MKRELYREHFDRTIFPVVAADGTGCIVYKNAAAGKYLPALRRGADIVRRLRGKKPLYAGMDAEVPGDTPYRRAVVLQDDDAYVFLFLSRLQYPDGDEEMLRMTERRGTALDGFLPAAYESSPSETESQPFRQSRIYADLIDICGMERAAGAYVYDICELLDRLSSKLKGAFRALGYRITVNIDAAVRDRKYVKLKLYDFIFLFNRLLYIQMKLSENGIVDIDIRLDEYDERLILCFSARTALTKRSLKNGEAASLLARLAPECALEFALFEDACLFSENMRLSVDKYGKSVMEYKLSGIETPAVLHVRSIDLETAELDAVIDMLILGIKKEIGTRRWARP